jgi:hypothetical protein
MITTSGGAVECMGAETAGHKRHRRTEGTEDHKNTEAKRSEFECRSGAPSGVIQTLLRGLAPEVLSSQRVDYPIQPRGQPRQRTSREHSDGRRIQRASSS